jgi:general secretion pathway protein H
VTSKAGERRAAGFTLLELLIVLGILGLTVALAVPVFSRAMPGIELRTSARAVAAELRASRSHALTINDEVAVAVDVEGRTVGRLALDPDIGVGLFTAAEEVTERGVGRIRFYPDGSSTGGRIRLVAGAGKYDVDVDWISGAVTVHD